MIDNDKNYGWSEKTLIPSFICDTNTNSGGKLASFTTVLTQHRVNGLIVAVVGTSTADAGVIVSDDVFVVAVAVVNDLLLVIIKY